MKFKMKPIKSVTYIIIEYFKKNDDMFIDENKLLLSSNATEIQKGILKCYEDNEYFKTLSNKKRNKIYNELTKF